MEITNAQYKRDIYGQIHTISCEINGEYNSVPISVGNKEYDEIMRQVDAGTLTIADAE